EQREWRGGDQAVDLGTGRAGKAADVEDIGEVVVEHKRQGEVDRAPVVLQCNPLVERIVVEKDRAHDVHGVLRQNETLLGIKIRIGEVNDERRIVIARVGAQQQGLHPVDQQFKVGQEPGVAKK